MHIEIARTGIPTRIGQHGGAVATSSGHSSTLIEIQSVRLVAKHARSTWVHEFRRLPRLTAIDDGLIESSYFRRMWIYIVYKTEDLSNHVTRSTAVSWPYSMHKVSGE